MPRTATAPRTIAPPPISQPDALADALVRLLTAAERYAPDQPAAVAFRAALRSRGEAAALAGGGEALDDLLARVRAADPDKAAVREAVLLSVWAGLPGWGR